MKTVLLLWLLWLPLCCSGARPAPAILVLGDSLSSAYGFAPERGWVRLLQGRLEEISCPFQVINLSISGQTTHGAAAILQPALIRYRPAIVIIALGGNDGLRGISVDEMRHNLTQLVVTARKEGARVLLLAMRLPPNYGSYYAGKFHAVYEQVAGEQHVPLVPFFLAGVAENRRLMQEDDIHPNASAQPLLLDTLWPYLEPLLSCVPPAGVSGIGVSVPSGE
jgi:acyl-CoA thioesterase-1